MQINRLLEIIFTLLQKKKTTATELAKQLGVSRSTICRDIDLLSMAGIPLYTERGKGGGISLLPSFVLSKSIFSEQEQDEILLALHGLSNIKDDTAHVLQKMSAIFNKAAQNWIKVDFSEWNCKNDFFNQLKTAILEQRIAEFDYYDSKGDKSFRSIEPIQLWFKSKSWYLKGFCLTKQDIRLYKLSRIKNLVVTDAYFNKRDLAAKPDSPMQKKDKSQMAMLKLRIEPELAFRAYDDFDESEVERQADGSFLITVPNIEENWVRGFLLSYGKHIEVLEPESVRNILKEESENIMKKYL